MSTSDTAPILKVLEITCGHCGHVRRFQRGERLNVWQLEDMNRTHCAECGARASVIGFVSYPIHPAELERLPAAQQS